MRRSIAPIAVALATTLPAAPPSATPGTTASTTAPSGGGMRVYTGSLRGDLKLSLPSGWLDEAEAAARPGAPSTIRMFDEARSFQVLFTIIPAPAGVRDFNAMHRLRELADLQGRRLLTTAVEAKLDIQELRPTSSAGITNTGGLYFTLTNKAPAPGSFEFMTNVLVGVGDMLLNVTVLTHQKDAPARRAALEMLASAQQVAPGTTTQPAADKSGGARPQAGSASPSSMSPAPATGANGGAQPPTGRAPGPVSGPGASPGVATSQPSRALPGSSAGAPEATDPSAPPAPAVLVAALPARTWAVVIDAPEFMPVEDQFSADGLSRRVFAVDPVRGICLSIHLEPAPIPTADANAAREFYLNRLRNSPMPIKDLKTGDRDDRSQLEYVAADLNQKHLNVFLSRDGVWIDVHVSAIRDPAGQIDDILQLLANGIRVESAGGK